MNETRIVSLKEIRLQGKILTPRRARKAHKCDECGLPIDPGTLYYEGVYGGSGLGGLKFPDHLHIECVKINEGGKDGSRNSSS